MKKVLIIGSNGMAGHMIFNYLSKLSDYEIWGIARKKLQPTKNIISLDVFDTVALETLLKTKSFDVVVNAVGLLNQHAESNLKHAIWVNSYFPHLLSYFSGAYGFKLIHLSTDCVFSGKKGSYKEVAIKDGVGCYAQSKSLGELINKRDLSLRTSIIGPELKKDGIGLFHWFMNQKASVFGFTNVYWSGVTTLELAKAIQVAVEQNLRGLYHLSNNHIISKYDLLVFFNQFFRNGSVHIIPKAVYKNDKSLCNTRTDFDYQIPSYKNMIKEMAIWVDEHQYLYNY